MAVLLHERWFVSVEGPPAVLESLSEPATLVAIGTAVAMSGAAALAWRRTERRAIVPGHLAMGATQDQLTLVYGWIPLLLAVHTAAPLVVTGVENRLLVPNLEMGVGVGAFVGLSEVVVALLLFYGAFTRYAALGLVGVWLAGVGMFGPILVNVLPALGMPVSAAAFVRMAGTVELTAGLLLVLGAFPRLVILILWLPFNLTLTAFGRVKLVGHLPIYAIMATILLWGAGGEEDTEALRASLIPVRGSSVAQKARSVPSGAGDGLPRNAATCD